jgi:argininosuccinate lyase
MDSKSTRLWGGRFAAEPAAVFLDYSQSIDTDSRMAAEDIWGSEAHVLMLGKQGILADDEVREILRYLEQALARVQDGTLTLDPADEDIHMNLEKHVIQGTGAEYGGKMHTARSRNDQVVTDSRLRLRAELLDVADGISALQECLLDRASGHERSVMPGYTHTQHAQPISVAFWLTGHVSALVRDHARVLQTFDRANACPLGACALAGTSFPTDRALTARLLGFPRVEEHALDAVGSRDIVIEAVAALSILYAHLSRMAEELVVFSTYEFGMIEISDALASGSSIMPQKKNPCLAELARSRAGEMYGCLVQTLTMMKALISGYNRDIQEDKPPLWRALDLALQTLGAMAAMVRSMALRTERMRELAGANFATATELANWLVRDRGLPFRRCHEIVGTIVRRLIEEGRALGDADRVAEILAEHEVAAAPDELAFLDPLVCLERQKSLGSTGPDETLRMHASLVETVRGQALEVAGRRERILEARAATAKAVEHMLSGGSLTELEF